MFIRENWKIVTNYNLYGRIQSSYTSLKSGYPPNLRGKVVHTAITHPTKINKLIKKSDLKRKPTENIVYAIMLPNRSHSAYTKR